MAKCGHKNDYCGIDENLVKPKRLYSRLGKEPGLTCHSQHPAHLTETQKSEISCLSPRGAGCAAEVASSSSAYLSLRIVRIDLSRPGRACRHVSPVKTRSKVDLPRKACNATAYKSVIAQIHAESVYAENKGTLM
ncbi:hypothetical protein RRG08_043270 [Elysia crispata]|uniref:Uncharacterized protein n=1 Tax=Elysia crispata TaxID=231223 RepID=A0AAE0XYH7_9GAST|nr:hypothetical protein RRG08_043270 [Elysia crispata]